MENFDASESENPPIHVTDFSLHDFVINADFQQFIDLSRGETELDPIVNYVPEFNNEVINGCLVDDNLFGSTQEEDIHGIGSITWLAQNFGPYYSLAECLDVHSLPCFDGENEMKGEEEEDDDENDDEDSSGTTTSTKRAKVDRLKTLISERKRRGRMKEKLYALRSMVPNITKMDKASIIGDAVLYIQELQMQIKKLRGEIAGLEWSLQGPQGCQNSTLNQVKTHDARLNTKICKRVEKMDIFQMEERGFYARLVCHKEEGLAVALYEALESLTGFIVQSSNLASSSDGFKLTFTLNAREGEMDGDPGMLRQWLMGALLNQGFSFL
ncbi:Myc-type, basic helix-loop-helix (bHLH) domain [Dillenia turbinata]|uniref:Myc-type, basic helix-loop-helix (BHLH) domain n=1 Tax=Dillenia turbinata TaxID=194707 RepID=A0AAN8V392_9MAGN